LQSKRFTSIAIVIDESLGSVAYEVKPFSRTTPCWH
jgi:hypothetical protein